MLREKVGKWRWMPIYNTRRQGFMYFDRSLSGEAIDYFLEQGYLLSSKPFVAEQIAQLLVALDESDEEGDPIAVLGDPLP